MRRNKLRAFPGRTNGKERLRPFARPEMLPGAALPPQPICYTVGTCLARTIDKSLGFAGLTNYAAHNGLPRKNAAFNAPTVFHKVCLPSIENELRWAADPSADAGVSSLAEFKGELVDLQISAQFAHPHTKAEQLRRDYNSSFAKAYDADLIFITIGVTECWFDTTAGIYINGLPPPQLEKAEPGRFELHEWQVKDVTACLGRIYDLLQAHSTRPMPPRLAICVSPVGIGFGHGAEDQLIADIGSKAIMRVAASEFVRDHEFADYAPIYEFAVLSDRSTVYETGLIDHLNISCIDRFLGEYFAKHGVDARIADTLTARGLANTHMSVDQYEEAAAILDQLFAKHGPDEGFLALHARALQSAGRKDDAMHSYIRHAETGAKGAAISAGAALNIALGNRDIATAERIVAIAFQSDDPAMAEKIGQWTSKIAQARQSAAQTQDRKQRAAALLEQMLISPQAVVEELQSKSDDPATPDQIKWIYAQALGRIKDDRMPNVLFGLLQSGGPLAKQAGSRLLNLARKNGGTVGEYDEEAIRKALVNNHMKGVPES